MGINDDLSIIDKFRRLDDFPAFEALAHALWKDEAAVMVGAGFSRFCIREKNTALPPLWSNFKKEMMDELGYQNEGYENTLRLAQEYKTLHGSNGLDELIYRLVTDEQWEPGPLHQQLLELPWRDVLTTNWDTLLERTKPQTPDRIYSCVRTIRDIPHKHQPRIVKLHGTLPSHRPFILTEDDYRTYKVKFAPFVNTVQQIMLEHDLCLVGFSGHDPNFLAWSGWVRDALDVSARQIRLVGVLKLSPVSRTLLMSRNVTPIDLSCIVSGLPPEEQHEKAFEYFFKALLQYQPPSPYEWAIDKTLLSKVTEANNKNLPTRAEVLKVWRKDRDSYPGWIVCPDINIYRHQLRDDLPTKKLNESPEVNLRFLLERLWRKRIVFKKINNDDIQEIAHYYKKADKYLSNTEKINLCTMITKELRHQRKWDIWKYWMKNLNSIQNKKAALHYEYEKGLRAISDWDDEAVLTAANNMISNEPIWLMRRAGLLATLFRGREAVELYRSALLNIRHKLLLNPKSPWLISLEAWAELFYYVSSRAHGSQNHLSSQLVTNQGRTRHVLAKTDPWEAIFRINELASDRILQKHRETEQWEIFFKPGRYKPIGTRWWDYDECPFYSLIQLIEKTGAPEYINHYNVLSTSMETTYRAIISENENDILMFFCRYHGYETKILDSFMSRIRVAQLSTNAIKHFMTVIPKRIDRIVKLTGLHEEVSGYLEFLLELLARIIIRSSSIQALKIFEWLIDILNLSTIKWIAYTACQNVLDGAIEAMESKEREVAIRLAINMKMPKEINIIDYNNTWFDFYNNFSHNDIKKLITSDQVSSQIDTLISTVKNGSRLEKRKSLIWLHLFCSIKKIFSSTQYKKLKHEIWEKDISNKWPYSDILEPWMFLQLPGKNQAKTLFIDDIIGRIEKGEIKHQLLMNMRAGLMKADITVPKDVLISCIRSCLAWAPTQIDDIDIFSRTYSKEARFNKFTSHQVGITLAEALLPCFCVGELPNDVALQLINVQKIIQIPSLVAGSFQVFRLWPHHQDHVFKQIRSTIASRDPINVNYAYIAIKQFVDNALTELNLPYQIKELLLHACEQRTQPGLSQALNLLENMIEKKLLNRENIDRVANALPYILKEYRYDQKNMEALAVADLPNVRKELHRLSILLFDQYNILGDLKSKLTNDVLPEVRFIN